MTSVFEVLRERVSMAEIIGVEEGRKTHCVAPDHTDADPRETLGRHAWGSGHAPQTVGRRTC